MKPKISPKEALRTLARRGVYSLTGMDLQIAITEALSKVRLTKTGKSKSIYSGINFRFGNKSGWYMPRQGTQECTRRLARRLRSYGV